MKVAYCMLQWLLYLAFGFYAYDGPPPHISTKCVKRWSSAFNLGLQSNQYKPHSGGKIPQSGFRKMHNSTEINSENFSHNFLYGKTIEVLFFKISCLEVLHVGLKFLSCCPAASLLCGHDFAPWMMDSFKQIAAQMSDCTQSDSEPLANMAPFFSQQQCCREGVQKKIVDNKWHSVAVIFVRNYSHHFLGSWGI